MGHTNPSRSLLLLLTFVSILGLALAPLLLLQPNLKEEVSSLRIPLISIIYTVICIGGIVAVFYPNKCRMVFQQPNSSANSTKRSTLSIELMGHHPNCEKFSNNLITIRGSIFCAACTGLLAGAVTAIVGVCLFSFGFFREIGTVWFLSVGEAFMLMGLAQIIMAGYIKVAVNALFVIGSFISLAAVELIGQSWLVDAYFLGLIVFMLWFRILLSEWNNERICRECGRCV